MTSSRSRMRTSQGEAMAVNSERQPVHLYLDDDFAEMATGFQIFERRRDILHLERLVDYWSDVEVFDHADHPLEHLHGPDDHPLNAQSLGQYRQHIEAPPGARQQADQAD